MVEKEEVRQWRRESGGGESGNEAVEKGEV